MNAQQWERAKEIFDAALTQPQAERSGFVMHACSDDPDLIAEVLELLEADAQAGSFLDTPIVDLKSDSHRGITPVQLPFNILHAGEMISGRFEIGRFLGQGGMGQVYEAKDIELGICVALKTIRPEISSDEHVLARFKKEVHLTRRVTHPNVCRVFDIGRHTPTAGLSSSSSQAFAFLTMELLEGETLSDLLRRKRKLETSETLPIAEQVADGLTAAHRLGIVHRDIKPSNILLVASGTGTRVVVTDFGLARSVTAETSGLLSQSSKSLTGQGRAVGTLAYMAPEQLTGAEITPATDIYAFGLVLYEMVTGTRVFDPNLPFGGIAQRLDGPPALPRLKAPELDDRWESTIVRCLQVDPAARFQSAQEVVEAITVPTSGKPIFPLRKGARLGAVNRKPVARTYKIKIGTSLIAALLALALMGVAFRLYKARVKIPEGSSMLLTDIDNETQDPELNAVSDVLRTQLSQSERFDLVDRGKIHDTLGRMGKPYRQDLSLPWLGK